MPRGHDFINNRWNLFGHKCRGEIRHLSVHQTIELAFETVKNVLGVFIAMNFVCQVINSCIYSARRVRCKTDVVPANRKVLELPLQLDHYVPVGNIGLEAQLKMEKTVMHRRFLCLD